MNNKLVMANVILFVSVKIAAAYSLPMETEASGMSMLIPVMSTKENSSHNINPDEKQYLWDSLQQNQPYVSIDVSYIRRKVVPGDVFKKELEQAEKALMPLLKKRGLQNATISTQGQLSSDGEHVLVSKIRVRKNGFQRIRTDITHYSGDNNDPNSISAELINIYSNGQFYFIDKTHRIIEIYNKPQFRGSTGAEMLGIGKTSGCSPIRYDARRLVEPNEMSMADKTPMRTLSIKRTEIDAKLTSQVHCVNSVTGKPDYDIFLDPNDWGTCYKIIRYDKDTGDMSQIDTFSDFRHLKGKNDTYPYRIIRQKFRKKNKEVEREVIEVSDVVVETTSPEKTFEIKVPEFQDFQIVDNRLEPPIRTFNRVHDSSN